MNCTSTISPILRVAADETIYGSRCDQVQPAYAHIRTRELYCAICDAPYDEDLGPDDYEPYIPANYFNPSTSSGQAGIAARRV